MIKLACMTWVYADATFERALEGISSAGFRYVSFGLPHVGESVFDDSLPAEADRILRLLQRYELKPVTLVSTDALEPQQPIEKACRRMDFARELGVKELLSLGTYSYRQFPDEPLSQAEMVPLNDAFTEKFKRVAEEAGKRDLVVSIKPHTGNTATSRELTATLQQIGSPHVKVCYDPGNVRYYEGIDPATDIRSIASEVVSLVAKDHSGIRAKSDFPIPGKGEVGFGTIFAELKTAGFAGPVIVERLDGKGETRTLAQLDERVAESLRNLERITLEAGFINQ